MLKPNQIYQVHERLFAAAAGDISFGKVLEEVVSAFGGAGGVIFELNRKTGEISNWIGPGLEDGEKDYIDHLNSINPRMHYSLTHVPGHIIYESKFIDDRGIDRHEFYDAINKSNGVRYFLGSRLFDDGDTSVFHSIEFTKQHGHPDEEKIASFQRIAPAIGNAWKLASRNVNLDFSEHLNAWTPDHLPWSIFALSSNGAVLSVNRRARALLEEGNYVELHEGVLTVRDQISATSFEHAIRQGLAGHTSDTLLHAGEGKSPFIAQIVPANPEKISTRSSIAILVYVWNPMLQTRQFGNALTKLYKFTPAELSLATQLANGTDLNTAADHLNITRNTARNQLQKMFAKTGTHRQNEFLVQIMGILDH